MAQPTIAAGPEAGAALATVWLDQPERGNALSAEMVERLIAEVTAAQADPAVRVLVLRGRGRHFCTGFDLGDLEAQSDGDLLQRFVRIETLLSLLWDSPVPTVAVAAGRTWGAGADLVAACDARWALDDATFRFPGAGFGLVLGTRRLAERVGPDLARALTVYGQSFDAEQALRHGLATHRLTADACEAALAEQVAVPGPDRETVAALHRAMRPSRADEDLAALVRSAARPGLGARLRAYRDAARKSAGR